MLDALLFAKTPSLLTAVYRHCLWRVNTTGKTIYLTFDDGPIPEVTPQVLEILGRYNAKATFFCIGKNIDAHPEVFKQVVAAGHTIGNHTYHHLNGWHTPTADYLQDAAEGLNAIQQQLPNAGPYFRPPYGKLKPAQYRALKESYRLVMWDVLSYDFDLSVTADAVLHNVLTHTRQGSVVVFHDSLKAKEKVLYALPKMLQHFTEQGFKFAAL